METSSVHPLSDRSVFEERGPQLTEEKARRRYAGVLVLSVERKAARNPLTHEEYREVCLELGLWVRESYHWLDDDWPWFRDLDDGGALRKLVR